MVLASIIYNIFYICKNHANYGEKAMEKQEYFKKIADEVKKQRVQKDLGAYREGKTDALRQVLIETGKKYTYRDMIRRFEKALKFLRNEKQSGKLAIADKDTDIWEKKLCFNDAQLMDFVILQFQDYEMRLKKAREIHALDNKIIKEMTQLTID